MSRPDPNGPPDLMPIQVGDVLEHPLTRERSTVLELPWKNPEGRANAELTALVGARRRGTPPPGTHAVCWGFGGVSMNSSISMSGPTWLSEMKAVTPRPERRSTCSMNFCCIAF